MLLPYVHIAGAGGKLHIGTAAVHRPFQFMTAQRALHSNWEIGVNRAGTGVHVQIEAVGRANCQANGSRAGVQAPGTAHTAVGAKIAAAAAGAQTAFDAEQVDSARTGLNIYVARSGKLGFNVTAAGMRVKRGGPLFCLDASASGLHVRASSDLPYPDIARSSLGLHLGADALDSDIAGAAVSLHRGIGRDGYLVADGDVPAHILRQVVADANAVSVLLNGWVRDRK